MNRGRFTVLSSDSEGLVVNVCRAPSHAVECGITVPASEGCPHVPKRLQSTQNRQANATVAVLESLSGALAHIPLTESDSIVPQRHPFLTGLKPSVPSRRLVLVAEGEHVEASTQPASFVPTWRDATDDEDMVDALQHDFEGDPQRAQLGWAEVEQDFGELNILT